MAQSGPVDLMVRILTDANLEGVRAAKEGVEGLDKSTGSLRGNLRDTRVVAGALGEALDGNVSGALQRLTSLTGSASSGLAKLGALAAAFTAGYGLGDWIDRQTGLSDKIARLIVPLNEVDAGARLSKEALEEMSKVNMEKLKADLSGISAELERTEKLARAVNQEEKTRIQAEAERDVAKIRAEGGPDADRRIVERRALADDALRKSDATYQTTSLEANQKALAALEEKKATLEREVAEAQERRQAAEADYREASAAGSVHAPRYGTELSNAGRMKDLADEALKAFMASYEEQKLDRELKVRELQSQRAAAPLISEAAGYQQRADLGQISSREAEEKAKRTAAESAARVSAMEAQLKAKERELEALESSGADRVARERGEADAAAGALAEYEGMTTSQRRKKWGARSISIEKDLRATAEREAAEAAATVASASEAVGIVVASIRDLSRKVEVINSQMRNSG